MTATILGLSSLALSACDRRTETKSAQALPARVAPAEVLAPPLPPPTVDRAQLLQAIATARSAYAAGQVDAGAGLVGRRFAIRQAFGCKGAVDAGAPAGAGAAHWTWGRGQKSIEISLTPADWAAEPMLAGATGWEAVEGYWLARPWLRTDGCPAGSAETQPQPVADEVTTPSARPAIAATPPISGLAAVFAKGGSRVGRREGKAFVLTLRGDSSLSPPPDGYRLVIEGRFAAFPDGRAIRCHSSSVDQPPICIAAAEVDRFAFEGADGKLLKEWRPADGGGP